MCEVYHTTSTVSIKNIKASAKTGLKVFIFSVKLKVGFFYKNAVDHFSFAIFDVVVCHTQALVQ